MKSLKSILPKGVGDIGATTFFIVAVPLVFFFELNTVLPHYYEPGTIFYYIHLINAIILFTNIMSSYFACIFTDTSIKSCLIIGEEAHSFCEKCEANQPERAWHCDYCQTCILKRDHHCIFTSCCIGYFNHRYFVMLLFYVSIGTMYASYFNFYYCYENIKFNDFVTILRLILPIFMLVFGNMQMQFTLIVTLISFGGCLFALILLYIHVKLILNGTVCHEQNVNINKFNLGLKENIIIVFGEKWYFAWLSPFIYSKLPGDGIHYKISNKNK